MLIDTHCHLDALEFAADRAQVCQRAADAGVAVVVVPAVDLASSAALPQLAEQYPAPRIGFALGIHPLYSAGVTDDDLVRLRRLLEQVRDHPALVGVGEIGLDHFVPDLDRAQQERVLEAQLRMARDLELPVLLHVRRAVDRVTAALRRFRPVAGIAHAFNGSVQQAQQLMGLGVALGFGGAMTWSRALQLQRLARQLPLEHLVLETDAPDMAPAWQHPQRNEPAELAGIARFLAEQRDMAVAGVIAQTAQTARRVLPALNRPTLAGSPP